MKRQVPLKDDVGLTCEPVAAIRRVRKDGDGGVGF
jgi:hypothetical protein